MMETSPLRVRLTVEHMKAEIVHAFAARADELQQQLEAELDAAIKAFDWEAETRLVMQQVVREGLRNGMQHALHRAVWENKELRSQIDEMVMDAVSDLVKKR